jgi:hypothetical protein
VLVVDFLLQRSNASLRQRIRFRSAGHIRTKFAGEMSVLRSKPVEIGRQVKRGEEKFEHEMMTLGHIRSALLLKHRRVM